MIKTLAYGAPDAKSPLQPMPIERQEPAADEILLRLSHCGVCHSDVHQARNEWHNTVFPCIPGHEIIGIVEKAGEKVTRFQPGDRAGVGCMVDSCGTCPSCKEGLEQYCESPTGFLATYNGYLKTPGKDNLTFGGYSSHLTVKESFALTIPESLSSEEAAPLLCAGITVYSPLHFWDIGKGDKVGIAGLGGLGHMAIKIAHAMGAEVTVITTSPDKVADAKKFGASHAILSKDKADMEKNAGTLDYILSTIPSSHDANPYIPLLKRDGVMTIVGCINPLSTPLETSSLIMNRRSLNGSLIGGIEETQEMLDFCAKHRIAPAINLIEMQQINEAYDRIAKGGIDHRFVIDLASLDKDAA